MNGSIFTHLLFYGPPGTGKTSTILALAKELYGLKNISSNMLELNTSDDRGIKTVRSQIKEFIATKSLDGGNFYKLVVLDEADEMTIDAQIILKQIMEKYSYNAKFCLIGNNIENISPELQSRCNKFRFSPLPSNIIKDYLKHILK